MYVHCKSSLSNLLLVQNVQLLYTQFLVYFINVTTLHICYNVTFFVCFIVVTKLHLFCHNVTDTMLHNLCHNVTGTMLPKSLSQCYYNFFRNLCSPLSHMLLYTWLILIACNDLMTYQGHIACFYLNFLIVYQKYFSLFVSGLHSNIFCLLIPDWFNDVPLVIVVLLWYPLYR